MASLDQILASIQSSASGFPALITGLLGAGGLYKLLEKWMDNRNAEAGRKAVATTERHKADAERIKELEAQLIPALKQLGELEWCKRDNTRLERENSQLKAQVKELEIDLIQEKTVAGGFAGLVDLLSDAESVEWLRRKSLERQKRQQELKAKEGANNAN
jgi:hypothetical protein